MSKEEDPEDAYAMPLDYPNRPGPIGTEYNPEALQNLVAGQRERLAAMREARRRAQEERDRFDFPWKYRDTNTEFKGT